MAPKRRSQKGQRLSDFFPPVKETFSTGDARAKSTIQEDRRKQSTRSTSNSALRLSKSTKISHSTPVFDPDLHYQDDDVSNDSEEDDFVKSLRFSPAKVNDVGAFEAASTPKHPTPTHQPYHVVVDYNSDSEGFAFSPVKFTPRLSASKAHKRVKGTPLPSYKNKHCTRMIWNSAKKKVEEQVYERMSVSPGRFHSAETEKQEGPDIDPRNELMDRTPISPSANVKASGHSNEQHPVSALDAERQQESSVVIEAKDNVQKSIRAAQAPARMADKIGARATTLRSIDRVGPQSVVENRLRTEASRRSVTNAKGHLAPLTAEAQYITRSPRVHLTRAVSGVMHMEMLEKLSLPAYITSSDKEGTKVKPNCNTVRLPRKEPLTVPKPFDLSKNKSHVQEISDTGLRAVLHAEGVSGGPGQRRKLGTQPEAVLPSTGVYGKRKVSAVQPDIVQSQGSAKRVKIDDHERALAPLRRSGKLIRSTSASLTNQHKFRTYRRKRREELHETGITEHLSKPLEAGLVPRTLYSPERQFRLNKMISPTIPRPFKFSTEERAVRSPNVSPIVTLSRDNAPRKVPGIRVPALTVPPFIPKPSNHPSTIAASPARKLPSRLMIRREFDLVAEKHAEEVLERKRREEEFWAAERERKSDERSSWRTSGKAAIEEWAARTKMNSAGKRDWID